MDPIVRHLTFVVRKHVRCPYCKSRYDYDVEVLIDDWKRLRRRDPDTYVTTHSKHGVRRHWNVYHHCGHCEVPKPDTVTPTHSALHEARKTLQRGIAAIYALLKG